MLPLPVNECLIISIRNLIIPIHSGFHIFPQCTDYTLRYTEVHICHPHCMKSFFSEHFLLSVPFITVCISSVYINQLFHSDTSPVLFNFLSVPPYSRESQYWQMQRLLLPVPYHQTDIPDCADPESLLSLPV